MKLIICSAEQAIQLVSGQPQFWNVISISSQEDGWPKIKKYSRTYLKSIIPDTVAGPILPTEIEIKKCLEFARKNWDNTLLIHCRAGVSRSTAIGLLVLLDKFREADFAISQLYQIRTEAYPNTFILKLGLEILIPDETKRNKVWNKIQTNKIWQQNHQPGSKLILPSWAVTDIMDL